MQKDEGTLVPNKKVSYGAAVGGPLAILAAWGLSKVVNDVPPEATAAIGSLLTTLIAYMTRETKP